MKHVASISFGKDSLAMLLRLLEEEMPLDEVIFYDTGMEFQAIYETRDRLIPVLNEKGIEYTELKPDYDFRWKMFDKPVNGKNGFHYGYSWCGGPARWGTSDKLAKIRRTLGDCIQYVGIAADEAHRKKSDPSRRYPLIEWGMTEADCLEYCHSRGFRWDENGVELYSILDRVSCWCCANKNLKELKNIYLYLPEYWKMLRELQSRTERPFKKYGSIFDLEERFREEGEQMKIEV